jgi:VCBS repeat-containing protein
MKLKAAFISLLAALKNHRVGLAPVLRQTAYVTSFMLLVVPLLAHAEVRTISPPPDTTLTHPENPVARNMGVWDGGSEDPGGQTVVDKLQFRVGAGKKGIWYEECLTAPFFHAQHVVRLPNKDGRAYFVVSNSNADSLLGLSADPSGYLSFYRTDVGRLDPETDLINGEPIVYETGGLPIVQDTVGEVVTEITFDENSPIGVWNHPAKMAVIGNLLLVAAQDWNSGFCADGSDREDGEPKNMAVLFFDVRDPENPQFWGRLTAVELGLDGVSTVNIAKAGSEWVLIVGNKWWRTRSVSPDINSWTYGGPATISGNLQGDYFASFELYDSPANTPADVLYPGVPRIMWGNGREGAGELGLITPTADDEDLVFSYLNFTPDSDFVARVAFTPTEGQTGYRATNSYGFVRPAPNLWTIFETGTSGKELGFHRKDYDASGVSVRRGMPVFYSPIVFYKQGMNPTGFSTSVIDNILRPSDYGHPTADKIYQVWNPANLALQEPLPSPVVTHNRDDSTPGSLRYAMAFGGVITFDAALNGQTITLRNSNGPLYVGYADSVTIDASNLPDGVTVSGDTNSNGMHDSADVRVFEITEGKELVMKNVTISGGYATQGAGIFNENGRVILENCVVENNKTFGYGPLSSVNLHKGDGGGILNGAHEVLVDSTRAASRSDLVSYFELRNSTVRNNEAHYTGGGIANIGGEVVIDGSTISGNFAEYTGGGIYSQAGFMASSDSARNATVTVQNSTIAENSAQSNEHGFGAAGIVNDNSHGTCRTALPGSSATSCTPLNSVYLNHVTVANNTTTPGGWTGGTAGIYNDPGDEFSGVSGNLTLENSIVANNVNGAGNTRDMKGVITTTSPNIATSTGYSETRLSPHGVIVADPMLGPLGDYGGPTRTMAPSTASFSVINMARGSTLTTDQRGVMRPQPEYVGDGIPDLGAVEVGSGWTILRTVDGFPNQYADPVGTEWIAVDAETHNGVTGNIAQSGHVGELQNSRLELSVTGPGRISFWWKLADKTDNPYDSLEFYPGAGRQPVRLFDGGVWSQVSVLVPPGWQTLAWEFRDGFEGSGGGKGWLDEVVFEPYTGTGDDADMDGIPNIFDNCETVSNADQSDYDNDGVGDLCDSISTLEDGSPGSLRDIIERAPSGHVITFDPSLAGQTILLNGGRIEVDKELTIDASNLIPGLTISGNNRSQIFYVRNNGALKGNLTLIGLTLKDGAAGLSGGCILIDDSSGGGGASATIDRTTITGCRAQTGGAIANRGGRLTLINSTLFNNEASGSAGGIYTAWDYTPPYTTIIRHSTIAGNRAAFGAGGVSVSTENNQGPDFVEVENSIIAGNSVTSTSGCPDLSEAQFAGFLATGPNLIGNNRCAENPFPAGLTTGTRLAPLDADLGPFADYGGPTPTMQPNASSPAVDAAAVTGDSPATDQRGVVRPGGVANDLGAVERHAGEVPNSAPTVANQFESTAEDVPLNGTLSGDDADDDILSFTQLTDVANGSVLFNPDGTYTYSPAFNFHGQDSFTFKANDGDLDSNAATLTVTVTPVNDAPVLAGINDQSVAEGEIVLVNLSATDVDNDTQIFGLEAGAPGFCSVLDAQLSCAPGFSDAAPSYPLTVTVSDGEASDSKSFSLEVIDVNRAPEALDQAVMTDEDVAALITMTGSDLDGDGLTFSVVTGPANGILGGTGATRTYTPNADFNGLDGFTFRSHDGKTASTSTATVSITVNPVNDTPTANDSAGITDEDVELNGFVSGGDIDGDNVTFAKQSNPLHGSVVVNAGGSYTYTPAADYNGTDSFTFTAGDGMLNSLPATVSITVQPVNDVPNAVDDDAMTDEDTPITIFVLTNDDGGPADEDQGLTVSSVSQGANGTVTTDGTAVTYTPNANFNGTDSFTYFNADSGGLQDKATVTITVRAVNDAPIAVDDTVTSSEDTAVTTNVLANDSDLDGDAVSVTGSGNGMYGVVTCSATDCTYVPVPNFNGNDSYSYTMCDNGSQQLCDSAVVSVIVLPVNDMPTAVSDSAVTAEDTAVTTNVLGNDSDIDGDDLSVDNWTDGTYGSVSCGPLGCTYTPLPNVNGTDSYTYTMCDSGGPKMCATATVEVTVSPVNDAPTVSAGPATQDVQYSDPVSVTISAGDVDSSTLSVSTTALPTGLSLGAAGCIAGAPPAGCSWTISGNIQDAPGTYPVTVTITDNGDLGTPAKTTATTFNIVVVAEDTGSTYTGPLFLSSAEDGSYTVHLRATISDADDGYAGDIRNASVHFENESGTVLCAAADVTLVFAGDESLGSASCYLSGSLGNADEDPLEVSVVVDGHYVTSDNEVVVLVVRPGDGKITGGGQLVMDSSAGVYAADPNQVANYGFNAQAVQKGKNTQLKGRTTVIVRALDGRKYKIRSNALLSLGVDLDPDGDGNSAIEPHYAEFEAKANITDVTDPLNPISMGGNLLLQLRMTDNGEPGDNDTISITVWDGGILLFSTNWDGAQSVEQEVARGNLQVH